MDRNDNSNENGNDEANEINCDYNEEKGNSNKESNHALWKKEREKLPIILNRKVAYNNNGNSKCFKGSNNTYNEDDKNNYVSKNLLQLKQQEAKMREMRQYQESDLKIKEYRNRAYLHISSRLLERRPVNNELLRRVKERKEMQNQRYNNTAAGNRNSCSYDRHTKPLNLDKKLKNNPPNDNDNNIASLNPLPQLSKINALINIGSSQSPLDLHKDFGKRPEYLKKKKEELKEQKEYEKQREKEKKLPKGMRLVPENERQDKLKSLSEMKKELENELGKMPIARISRKILNRKIEIEESLRVIDIDLSKYSMAEVLIPIEPSASL